MKILLLDIETAPHRVFAWGLWGQDIHLDQIEEPGYTLCWAAKWLGKKPVHYGSVREGKVKMLRRVRDLLNEADCVVHFNGMKFDIPTLNGEFAAAGIEPPAPYAQVDLMRVVKQAFRLASNKLDYVARHLGLSGKLKHKGMELWRGCMAGDAGAWRVMEAYNKRDVTMLEPVYYKLLPWITGHPNHGLEHLGDHVCPNCGSKDLVRQGYRRTTTRVYRQYQCRSCGKWSRARLSEKGKSPEVVST